jgi:hypothetical protein
VADNPARLPPADPALVASWRHRLEGAFFIERYLKPHTIFLSEGSPARAYGVLGLVSPVEEIIGPRLPVYVQAVLLPFEGRIVYDSLLAPYAISFGPGIRRSLRDAYRDAQEREGVLTALSPPAPPASPEARRTALRGRAGLVLAAFRKDLLRAGLSPPTAEQHVAAVTAFVDASLLGQTPPRGLLERTRQDLHAYLSTTGRTANRVSFRRFVRFLTATDRLDYDLADDLAAYLRLTAL